MHESFEFDCETVIQMPELMINDWSRLNGLHTDQAIKYSDFAIIYLDWVDEEVKMLTTEVNDNLEAK